jgi:hypothetical protein
VGARGPGGTVVTLATRGTAPAPVETLVVVERGGERIEAAAPAGAGASPTLGPVYFRPDGIAVAVTLTPRGPAAGSAAQRVIMVDLTYLECALSSEAIRPALDHAAPGVTTLAAPQRTAGRRLREAVRLGDGTTVRFDTGGCAHIGWVFEYDVDARVLGPSGAARLEAAARLLERTPVRDDRARDLARAVRRRLAAGAPALAPHYDLPCGDAACAVDVEPAGPGRARLSASYDFAL